MLVLGPEVPDGLKPLIQSLIDAIRELQAPTLPHPVFTCAAADLPPAEHYQNAIALNATTRKAVLSTWDGAQWSWLTCDGSPV